MTQHPHPDAAPLAVQCAILTVSDTRTLETDRSGEWMRQSLQDAGHTIIDYKLLPDEPTQIRQQVLDWCQLATSNLPATSLIDAVLINGGTGIAPRDTTYDAIEQLLERTLPGFGELFRWLSYQEIGSRAMASRAAAGVCQGRLIFSVPGSTNAVRLAMDQLILPELPHLVRQLNPKIN